MRILAAAFWAKHKVVRCWLLVVYCLLLSLSLCFKKYYARGYRYVQGIYFSIHRNFYQGVAVFSNEPVQSAAFAAQDERARPRPIPIAVFHLGVSTRANHPDISLLQGFDKTVQVSDFRDLNIFNGARGRFRNRVGQPHGSALWNNDAINRGTFGDTQYRSQVPRILDTVENENERRHARVFEDGISIDIISSGRKSKNALVICSRIQIFRQRFARNPIERDRSRSAQVDDLGQPFLFRAVSDHDFVDPTIFSL